jgi:hypothetical protein
METIWEVPVKNMILAMILFGHIQPLEPTASDLPPQSQILGLNRGGVGIRQLVANMTPIPGVSWGLDVVERCRQSWPPCC